MADNARSRPVSDDSLKETFESIVIAFILAFIFRAYVVEAFIIPTGSMAPTLLGAHVNVTCRECGYRYAVDVTRGNDENATRVRSNLVATCPMCGYPNLIPAGTRIATGDRILVHKYIYNLVEPARWDVVVFKNPQNPSVNFIKRLVGLPGEELYIIEGNLYSKPDTASDAAWHIDRKIDRSWDGAKVQNAVWQPIYHSQYVPLDNGDPAISPQRQGVPWTTSPSGKPWTPASDAAHWNLAGRDGYRYDSDAPGSLRFDFQDFQPRPHYAYDEVSGFYMNDPRRFDGEPIEDIRLATAVQPDRPGLDLTLSTTARWGVPSGSSWRPVAGDKPITLAAHINAQGLATLSAPDQVDPATGRPLLLARANIGPLQAGVTYRVELWYVDQSLSLWIDGRRVLLSEFELPIRELVDRDPLPVGYTPQVRIALSGSPAWFHNVELDRDLYYSSTNPLGMLARGGLAKRTGGWHEGGPVTIGLNQFFCMGDNSPLSHDSRYWDGVEPWIRYRMFPHVSEQSVEGMVPRQLMIGRAFFVYWPAMYSFRPDMVPLIPDFGDMRFIH